jgi:hypothetical protein
MQTRNTFEGCGVLGFNIAQFGEYPHFRSNLPPPSERLLLRLLFDLEVVGDIFLRKIGHGVTTHNTEFVINKG